MQERQRAQQPSRVGQAAGWRGGSAECQLFHGWRPVPVSLNKPPPERALPPDQCRQRDVTPPPCSNAHQQ